MNQYVIDQGIERRARQERILRHLAVMWLNSKRLAAMECVSLRTIWRDINDLRKQGHPIDSFNGNGGGYGLRRGKNDRSKTAVGLPQHEERHDHG